MKRTRVLAGLAAAGLGALLAACPADPVGVNDAGGQRVCTPGATQACVCAGGASGGQSCADDGSKWNPCACATSDAGRPDASASDAGEPSDASGADRVPQADAATADSAANDANVLDSAVSDGSSSPDINPGDSGASSDSSGTDGTVQDSTAGDTAGPDAGDLECNGKADYEPCATLSGSCLAGVCHEVGSCDDPICNTAGPSFVLPDTGQRACYDDTALMTCYSSPCNGDGSPDFCGQDAQYGWDTTHQSSARYTRNTSTASQPVVTDNVTLLVWQGCTAGLSGDLCGTGHIESRNWAAAKTYCSDLTWGGQSDWVLPDRFQLRSIVDYGRHSPSIDVTAMPETPSTWFWSSSSDAYAYPSVIYPAWGVNFGYGTVNSYSKNDAAQVRCVRAGP